LASSPDTAGWSRLAPPTDDDLGDELLGLLFTACHPILSPDACAALTLRVVDDRRDRSRLPVDRGDDRPAHCPRQMSGSRRPSGRARARRDARSWSCALVGRNIAQIDLDKGLRTAQSPALLAMGLGLMAVGATLAALVFANWSYILSVTKSSVAAGAARSAA
jgi:hypothetical protein